MSKVDMLIHSIGESAGKLMGGQVAESAELFSRLDITLAQLRAECRELAMMNQLLRERLALSLHRLHELCDPGSPMIQLRDGGGELEKLDPR